MKRLLVVLWLVPVFGLAAQADLDQPAGPELPPTPAGLFPFVLPWDDATPSVTDLSQIFPVQPAGARGWVTVGANGHLVYGGKPLRWWGANLVAGACFPSREEAPLIAARMAKFGINAVRFSKLDGAAAPEGLWTTWDLDRRLNRELLDRWDFFVAELKKQGIFVLVCLQSNRPYHSGAELPPSLDKVADPKVRAAVGYFDPGVVQLQKKFAQDLLDRTNPYTGLTYKQEPALAVLEIQEENGLVYQLRQGGLDRLPTDYQMRLNLLWNRWLQAKYQSQARLKKAWTEGKSNGLGPAETLEKGSLANLTLKDGSGLRTVTARIDWMTFLAELEKAYWTDFKAFLNKDLGFRSLVLGTSLEFSPPHLQAAMDLYDHHWEWRPPQWPDGLDRAWYVANDAMVNHPAESVGAALALSMVSGKPNVMTSFRSSAANSFEAEALPLLSVFAALTGMDAVFPYSYNSSQRRWDLRRIPGFYDVDQNPVKLVGQVSAALAFRRGDFSPLPVGEAKLVTQSREISFPEAKSGSVTWDGRSFGLDPLRALLQPPPLIPDFLKASGPAGQPVSDGGRGGVSVTPGPQMPKAATDPNLLAPVGGPFRWVLSPTGRFSLVIEAPTQRWLIGYVGGQSVATGKVRWQPGTSLQNGFSVQLLSSLDGARVEDSRKLLWTVLGTQENSPPLSGEPAWRQYPVTPIAFPPAEGQKITHGDQWGRPPSLVEAPGAGLILPVKAARVRAWALDAKGLRRQTLTVEKLSATESRITVGPQNQTLWYEIRID